MSNDTRYSNAKPESSGDNLTELLRVGAQQLLSQATANVLDKLPKSVQPKVKAALYEIYQSETREAAYKAFDKTFKQFGHKYPGAMKCLEKDKSELLAFYDFPAQHWVHIRTTSPIESAFSTVRLRTQKCKSCGSRQKLV